MDRAGGVNWTGGVKGIVTEEPNSGVAGGDLGSGKSNDLFAGVFVEESLVRKWGEMRAVFRTRSRVASMLARQMSQLQLASLRHPGK